MVATTYAGYHGVNSNSSSVSPAALADDGYLERYLSLHGIKTWTDHESANGGSSALASNYAEYYGGSALTTSDTLVLNDCKVYAGSLLAGRLANRYQYSMLANAPMAQEMWAVIVLRTLCFRRGNPPPGSLEFRYQEIMAKDGMIDQIAHGLFPLTDASGNPLRPKNANIPAHSNLMVDRRYAESQIRVWSGSSDRSQSALGRKFDRHNEYGE